MSLKERAPIYPNGGFVETTKMAIGIIDRQMGGDITSAARFSK
jgi:hypothetical protein